MLPELTSDNVTRTETAQSVEQQNSAELGPLLSPSNPWTLERTLIKQGGCQLYRPNW